MDKYAAEAIAKCRAPKDFDKLAFIIECIFKGLERGYSLQQAADRFNELGIKAIMGERFTANNVHRIIHVLAYQEASHFTVAMQRMLKLGRLNETHVKELEKHKAN